MQVDPKVGQDGVAARPQRGRIRVAQDCDERRAERAVAGGGGGGAAAEHNVPADPPGRPQVLVRDGEYSRPERRERAGSAGVMLREGVAAEAAPRHVARALRVRPGGGVGGKGKGGCSQQYLPARQIRCPTA